MARPAEIFINILLPRRPKESPYEVLRHRHRPIDALENRGKSHPLNNIIYACAASA